MKKKALVTEINTVPILFSNQLLVIKQTVLFSFLTLLKVLLKKNFLLLLKECLLSTAVEDQIDKNRSELYL